MTGGAHGGRAAVVLAALCALAVPVVAEQLPLARFTQADGLASDFITELYQGRSGFLWVGTHSGLSRFDGRRFVSYDTRHGLPHPTVRQVLETADGRLWVATDGGLARLERRQEHGEARFRAWTFGAGPERVISGLVEDRRGRLWIGSGNRVLEALEGEGDDVRFRRLAWRVESPRPLGRVLSLTKGREGDLWVGTAGGLVRVLADGGQRLYPPTSRPVRRVGFDATGTLWVTDRTVLLAFRPEPATTDLDIDWLQRYARAEAAPDPACRVRAVGDLCLYTHPDSLPFRWVLTVPDGAGVWISGNEGLARFDGESFRVVGADQPRLQDRIGPVLRDAAGSLWIGTWTEGLLRLPPDGIVNFREADGLRSRHLVQVLDTPRGELVAVTGTNDDFWLHVLTDEGRFRAFRPRGLEDRWTGWGRNQWIVRDSRGEWWFPSEGEALYRYPAVGKVEELVSKAPAARYTVEDGLPGDHFFRIYEDGNGDLWLGLLGGHGAVVWERSRDRFRSIGLARGLPPAGTDQGTGSATAFAEDDAGRLWIGFYSGGVARALDPRNREFEFFAPGRHLPPGFVSDLFVDSRGRLWIALIGAVVRVDDPEAARPRFDDLTASAGLALGRGCCFAEDRYGRVYVGSERGVARLHPDSGSWSDLTTADGLVSNLVRTLHTSADGDIWLGTRHGLTRLTPGRRQESRPPRVGIEAVRVAGDPWPVPELGADTLRGLTLRPGQRRLTIGYFGIALEPGGTLRYQYRLRPASRVAVRGAAVGEEERPPSDPSDHRAVSPAGGRASGAMPAAWSEPTNETSVTFEALPAGRFVFEVRAIRGDGTASATPATLAFERLPPVWQRGWFLALAVLVLAFAVWGLIALRDGRRRALDRQRERIARDLHDQLGSGLGSIGLVAELLAEEAATRPDRRDAAAEIAASARELGGSLSDIVWALDPGALSLEELLARLAQRGTALLSGSETELVCHFPENLPDDSPDGSPDRWPDARPSPAVRRSVLLIGLEALHNAARHARARRVELIAEPLQARHRWRLLIRDDGRGLPSDADLRGDSSRRTAPERRRHGRGMASMRRRAEEIGAALAWRPTPGGGTTVELTFSLRPASRWRRRPA